jgi:phage baseplate assembly protein W
MSADFIGAGVAFPLRIGTTGGLATVQQTREIEEAIRIILNTAPGERPMRPEFGCGIHDYVFAPADNTTAGQVAFEVQRALERWEPRIDEVDIDVDVSEDVDAMLIVTISYVIRGTNDPRNLVFPFYVIPTEESAEHQDLAEARSD